MGYLTSRTGFVGIRVGEFKLTIMSTRGLRVAIERLTALTARSSPASQKIKNERDDLAKSVGILTSRIANLEAALKQISNYHQANEGWRTIAEDALKEVK